MEGEFCWISHFIAQLRGMPVGFCQFYAGRDSGEQWLRCLELEGTYSIDYLIGERQFLRRGFGGQMLDALTREILRLKDARRIAVQPERENAASRALLQSRGFELVDEAACVYVKELR